MWRNRLLLLGLCVPGLLWAEVSGVELGNFDATVRAQDDFYRHVNGQWLKTTRIPADKSNYGSFTAISDATEKQLQTIIRESARAQAEMGTENQQVGDLYASFMAEKRINQQGLEPLQADLNRIDRLNHHAQIPALIAQLDRRGVSGLVSGYIAPDAKNPDVYTLYLSQSGLGLPDRDYYFEKGAKFQSLRQAYQAYVTSLLSLAGTIAPAEQAQRIVALETALAAQHWTKVANRDAEKTYNPYALATLNTLSPGFDFQRYLDEIGTRHIDTVVIRQPSYFAALGETISSTPLATWREYLRLRLLSSYAPYLSADFVETHFDFYGRTLYGITENRPRWKRGVQAVEDHLGEALGKIYVERHFSQRAKQRMHELVGNLIAAYRQSIQDLDWMGAETKLQALDKLEKFTPKIGYPDKWKDYSSVKILADDLVGNIRRARQFAHQDQVNKLGQPIDPTEWHMTPQTVNAYYNPLANEIVFPAAILQPPFFNLEADDAVNYGAIGAVIGHEIGHGFDDQGSRYDGDGRLRNWWTEADRAGFEQRTSKLIEQYNAYSPLPGYQVNGELTVGENIGDLGGLSIAAKAYALALEGRDAPVLDGYTGPQRLLIGWAQVWRRLYREEALINRLKTDPHAPSEYRCNGIVANLPLFHEAFGVKPGDGLYRSPEQQVRIW